MTIKILAKARTELEESADYYNEQAFGLGDEFLEEIEKIYHFILQYPNSGTKISSSERRILVNRFPYGIIYTVKSDFVIVIAVMNLRRKPDYWKKRK